MSPIEDKLPDVLQNIESVIVSTHREFRELSDYDVMRVLDAALDDWRPPSRSRWDMGTSADSGAVVSVPSAATDEIVTTAAVRRYDAFWEWLFQRRCKRPPLQPRAAHCLKGRCAPGGNARPFIRALNGHSSLVSGS